MVVHIDFVIAFVFRDSLGFSLIFVASAMSKEYESSKHEDVTMGDESTSRSE